ncbi:helix-turn-helix domain-containing protein [Kitasatospora sp. NPDC057692]|uniref:helix-turn-helix domain-containing protein n=1 Tax=Kitasatospora sp. NPDC057692 TaxID=3346215 RepID=UPI00369E4737
MSGSSAFQDDSGTSGGSDELAERLRALRSLTPKSLKELERVTLVSDSSWSRYLAGRGLPPWAAIEALCREAGEDPAELRPLWEAARDRSNRATGEAAAVPDVPDPADAAAPSGRPRRRRLALALASVGVLATAAAGIAAAVHGDERPAAGRVPPAASTPAGAPPAAVTAAPTPPSVPGALRAEAAVPETYRGVIELAARRCTEAEVTPSLLAAMLKAESDFHADLRDPKADEYGIARWTPSVFNAWAVDGDGDGLKDYMDPADAIATMGLFTCWLDQRIKQSGLHSNLPGLIAAAYRTSDKAVIQAGGPPSGTEEHVTAVLRYQKEFAAG